MLELATQPPAPCPPPSPSIPPSVSFSHSPEKLHLAYKKFLGLRISDHAFRGYYVVHPAGHSQASRCVWQISWTPCTHKNWRYLIDIAGCLCLTSAPRYLLTSWRFYGEHDNAEDAGSYQIYLPQIHLVFIAYLHDWLSICILPLFSREVPTSEHQSYTRGA